MASFFWGKGNQKDQYRVLYWPSALGLFAASSLAFFIAPWAGKPILAIANLSLVAGALCISLLFSQWNNSLTLSKTLFSSIWFVGVSSIYLYLLNSGTTQDRIHLMNIGLAAISIWQLSTLFSIAKKECAYQIKLLIAVEFFQLSTRILRSVLILMNPDAGLTSLYQEDTLGFSLRISSFLSNLMVCILITNYYLEKLMQEHLRSAHAIEDGMLHSLNALSMVRDNETGNHILRTKQYVQLIATRLRAMGFYKQELTEAAIDEMSKAAPLHDIGKVGIPDNILKKNGSLSDEEWVIMKTHASLGEDVLRAAMVEDARHTKVLDMAIKIAGGHHECWDGSGYPRGLHGLDIPLAARIMSIADMYDALVSERVYKDKWSHADACAEIARLKGTRFDPAIVEAFMMERDNFVRIADLYRDEK
ncbi:HD-GYP domain-containing protein [Polynucleobacter sp. AP-Nino-20-G2]|uniref:HD-GYP domain-containing protein n=1 Tax=Polynucleobacter sp. AP-Nino-20-G2 TaxID=2576917 RepID=UPI001BFCF8E5|nr:HD domain-containing phosphohydrolase [Polynucleobacter sp. AP-Nino-20-G2]QWE17261.1 HD domain-containing protein [Polynucleobacter sp. AP-Nino-20-G2]